VRRDYSFKMKKARKVVVKHRLKRRPIEDVPFYKVEHKIDDLPLDPFRPFIKEEISEFFFVLLIDEEINFRLRKNDGINFNNVEIFALFVSLSIHLTFT
jgi:hypothetical protein